MDSADFRDLTDTVIERLLPRMPQRFLDFYEGMQIGGEYWYLVESLVSDLVDDRIAVSAQERDQLYQMVNHLRKNEEMLEKLEGLTVESDR